MITLATRPLKSNLVFVRSVGACPRIGKVVTPVSILYLYFFTFWPPCSPAQITSFVIETSLRCVFVPIWSLINFLKQFRLFFAKKNHGSNRNFSCFRGMTYVTLTLCFKLRGFFTSIALNDACAVCVN